MSTAAEGCVFCRIVAGEMSSRPAYSGPLVYGFHDLQPVAPLHVLIVPREHIPDATEVTAENGEVLAEMLTAARSVAEQEGVAKTGYRLVFNVGRDAGAQVPHLHLHLLAGRKLGWPPG
ncbi:MAG TPA: HIT domain-containing protein [Acidimicrobiales bacterium]|nr:HIT domain-containing protein [Acidimicrobiales bacterium]